MDRTSLKLTPEMIMRRGHYCYFFYYWIYGLIADYRLAGKSLNQTIFNKVDGAFPVQSISYPYIKALIACVDFGSDEVFVDVGCAWGRLIGYMSSNTRIKKFIGVELNKDVAECARRIFYGDLNITIITGNIIDNLPLEGTIFFLFNPFDKTVLERFLNEIEENIHHLVKLMYLHPTCRELIDIRPRWVLMKDLQIKPKHLGALTLCIYEYKPRKTES